MNLTARYKHYLEEQKLSPLSVKNYLADLNKLLSWLGRRSDRPASKGRTFNKKTFQTYYQFLKDQSTPASSLKRYASSLRQFGQFLVSTGETPENPAIVLINTDFDRLLAGFEKSLYKEKLATATIRNYMVDVRQFLKWFALK